MSDFTTIKAAIVAIIQGQSNLADSVIDYSSNITTTPNIGYPLVTVTAHDGTAQFADTSRNRRQFIFSIKCYQERTQRGESESERIMTALVDELLGIFDLPANSNLNNTCVFAQPIPSTWGYVNAPDIDVRMAEILLVADVIQ